MWLLKLPSKTTLAPLALLLISTTTKKVRQSTHSVYSLSYLFLFFNLVPSLGLRIVHIIRIRIIHDDVRKILGRGLLVSGRHICHTQLVDHFRVVRLDLQALLVIFLSLCSI